MQSCSTDYNGSEQENSSRSKSLSFVDDDSSDSSNEDRHPLAHKSGGINLSGKKGGPSIQKQTFECIKNYGPKLLFGKYKDINSIKKPITMCKEISYLETIANEQLYASKFLNIAANSDSLEQMQLVLAYLIAGLHVNGPILLQKAPLEPLLGETLQLEKTDGTKYYAEQISISPAICRFQIIGPDNIFRVFGNHQYSVSLNRTFNTAQGKSKGQISIQFRDGNMYTCTNPEFIITGLIMGDRVLNYCGQQLVQCQQTKINSEVNFQYNSQSSLGFIGGKISTIFHNNVKTKLSDFVEISIYKTQIVDDEQITIPLSTGEGSWLEGVRFDSQMLWKINDKIDKWRRQKDLLTSDSYMRNDRKLLKGKKIKQASEMKKFLEDLDEKDLGLRQSKKQYFPI